MARPISTQNWAPSPIGPREHDGKAPDSSRRKQQVACELVEQTNVFERAPQSNSILIVQARDRNGVCRRNTVRDVLDLLSQDQVEERGVRVNQGGQVEGTRSFVAKGGQPRRCGSLHNLMTNRQ